MGKIIGMIVFASGFLANKATGQTVSQTYGDTLAKQTPTFFVGGEIDWTTYTSQRFDAQTSGSSQHLRVGGYAGESRNVGILFHNMEQKLQFKQQRLKTVQRFTDTNIEMRFGYLFPTAGISSASMTLRPEEGDSEKTTAQGANAGLVARFPMTPTIIINTKAIITRYTQFDRVNTDDTSIEQREAELHASIDITQHYIDFLIGYKAQQLLLRDDGNIYAETQVSPFVGLRLGIYF